MTTVDLRKIMHHDLHAVLNWLHKNYGPANREGRWYLTELTFIEFPSDKDAMMFTLRWS